MKPGLRQEIEGIEQVFWQCNNCDTMYPDKDNKAPKDYCIICGGDMGVNSTKRRMVLTFDAFTKLDITKSIIGDIQEVAKLNHKKELVIILTQVLSLLDNNPNRDDRIADTINRIHALDSKEGKG